MTTGFGFCANCGTPRISADQKFCAVCGTPLPEAVPPLAEEAPAQPGRTWKWEQAYGDVYAHRTWPLPPSPTPPMESGGRVSPPPVLTATCYPEGMRLLVNGVDCVVGEGGVVQKVADDGLLHCSVCNDTRRDEDGDECEHCESPPAPPPPAAPPVESGER